MIDGTFDNTETRTRQVFVNGILAYDIREDLIPIMRDKRGNKVEMLPFGHFHNFPLALNNEET